MPRINKIRFDGTDYDIGAEVDSSLTVEGKAADAKATGDAIAEVKNSSYEVYITDTASGSIAHFTDGADSIPMKDVLVHIEPVQKGSGDPSPDNVRPITGWTGANVTRAGKNIFLPARTNGTTTNAGITFTYNADGSVIANGTATGNAFTTAYNTVGIKFHLVPGTYVKSGASGNFDGLLVQYIDPADTSSWIILATSGATRFTITEEQSKYDVIVRVRVASGKTLEDEVYKPYIAFESSGSDYEPYSGDTYSITFPSEAGTVYGGTLDVTTGELVVDRAMVDLGALTWSTPISSNPNCFTARDIVSVIKGRDNALCNTYTVLTGSTSSFAINSAADKTLMINKGTGGTTENYPIGTVIVKDSDCAAMTESEFKTAMSGVQLVYELATPITYQLTPQEITSLLGENNVWADTGDSEVEYRADTKMYIDNKIAELQAMVLEG